MSGRHRKNLCPQFPVVNVFVGDFGNTVAINETLMSDTQWLDASDSPATHYFHELADCPDRDYCTMKHASCFYLTPDTI